MMDTRSNINAVIFETPANVKALPGRERTKALSELARAALRRSAELSAVSLGPLEKGDLGQPLPFNGIFWSISHTLEFAAAVVAPFPIGIDIEMIKPVTPALRNKAAAPEEWSLAGNTGGEAFYRFWTAKEAVLKAVGVGLGGLSKCRIAELIDENHTGLEYESAEWVVSHYFDIAGHVASITVPSDNLVWHT